MVPGPWEHTALVPGPNENLANGPGPKCNGPWSLGPFGQMSLVPGPPYRVSMLCDEYMIMNDKCSSNPLRERGRGKTD